ncbi:fructose-2,6-bisphosphatase TIGAR B-like isoform X1 [Oncorhynchus kisutch]|uniref:fructose-2,6-bisphosphatase TIGAR B-like isoform X1 n=1 Tax=Oncorhynchus kisutch TaxID=8019 RepID=UPI0012DEE2F2|nr:fructose-2,6-bisphosphatase TIGAR B-like isoform X1 [Oncorhynchus kisutch]
MHSVEIACNDDKLSPMMLCDTPPQTVMDHLPPSRSCSRVQALKSLRNDVHSSGVEMVFDPLLRERSFGIAEGRPKEDLKNMANRAGQSCRDYTPPGGETLEQVRLRCKKFLKSLYQRMVDDHGCSGQSSTAVGRGAGAAESGTDGPLPGLPDNGMEGVPLHALVVSHGAYICVAVRHFVEDLQCSLPQGLKMSKVLSACPNTGISRFVLIVSGATNRPCCLCLACSPLSTGILCL